MKPTLLKILICPKCGGTFRIRNEKLRDKEVESGQLACRKCQQIYPIINSVPRFVPEENYASNFGYQWNIFRKTQLDSHSELSISRDRFLRFSGWAPESLKGKRVLDVGCGSGRFTEIALSCAANVVAVDYSTAVNACKENLAFHHNRRPTPIRWNFT